MAKIDYAHGSEEELDETIEKSKPTVCVAGEKFNELWPLIYERIKYDKRLRAEAIVKSSGIIIGEKFTTKKKVLK